MTVYVTDTPEASPEPPPTSPRAPQPAPYYIQALPPAVSKIVVYECQSCFYLVGMLRRSVYSVMRVDRTNPEDPVIRCEPGQLTGRDVQEILSKAEIQNRGNGGLRRFCRVYGLLGMVKFVQGYYLLLVSKRRKVGAIAGHNIYTVEEISYLRFALQTAKFSNSTYADENRYSTLFFGYDFSNLYFSYTYDITRPLQYNMTRHLFQTPRERQEKFVWNHFLLERISGAQNAAPWTLPVIHGYFRQAGDVIRSLDLSGIIGKCLSIALISRRSRHFAGVRYLKRGLNSEGSCANDVETEQILQDLSYGDVNGHAHLSSYVQIRGSIPLFWSQEQQTIAPKPPITIFRVDPFYNALVLHFKDLFAAYSTPVIFLNLVKSREKVPRESLLKEQLEESLLFVNERLPADKQIVYIPWDFHEAQKNKNEDPVSPLVAIAETSLVKTGFFYSGVHGRHATTSEGFRMPSPTCEQNGIIRTNCIDSLDRTNAAQFCIGKVVLGHQLYVLGHSESRLVDSDDHLVGLLMNLYEDMGNTIALQYGGSQLAHTLKTYQRQSSSQARDLITTVQRYYNNSFTDWEKQAVMNLFLGHFVPALQTQRLWELETDYFLHMRTDYRVRPLSAQPWWTPPPPRLVSGPAPPPLFQQFGRYYRLGRLTSFDKMLSQAYNIPHQSPQAAPSLDGTENVKFYLPGVKRWFGSNTASPARTEKMSADFPPIGRRRASAIPTAGSSQSLAHSGADLVEQAYLLYGVHLTAPVSNAEIYEQWWSAEFLTRLPSNAKKADFQRYAEVRNYRNHTILPKQMEQKDKAIYAAYEVSSVQAPMVTKTNEALYRSMLNSDHAEKGEVSVHFRQAVADG